VYNVPDTEIAALQDLYDATNGDSWTWDGTGNIWNFTNPNPCVDAWQGVNCSEVVLDGYMHVVELHLDWYGLAGTIPPTIDQLEQLVVLDVSSNALTSTIPDSVGQLRQLTWLSLEVNQLTGTFPASLDQLTQVVVLVLGENRLTGTVPESLQQLTQLTRLYLAGNQLTGTVPAALGELTLLEQLYLDNNQLSGTTPDSFGQLTQLYELHLSNNQLTGTISASLDRLVLLEQFYLDRNLLSGPIPEFLPQLAHLTELYLYANHLTGTVPASLGQLMQLTALTLDDNQLSGTIPESLQELTQLTLLYLNSNLLTGTIPAVLGQLTLLVELELDTNLLHGNIPDSFQQLTELVKLFLFGNMLSGVIPTSLGELSQLRALGLEHNRLAGTIPDSLQQLQQLILLGLNSNLLSGTIPVSLGNFTRLGLLALDSNQLSGTIPESLQLLTQIRLLDLQGNQLSGSIPAALSELTLLGRLFLSDNLLTRTVPESLHQLTHLTLLLLNRNQLTGTVPNSLSSLVLLKVLELGTNQLTGSIPDSLSQLTVLEGLSMQSNKLTGTIPPSLARLPRLRLVTLGDNKLRGTIPQDWSAAANILEMLHLHENHLSGPIPESLGNLPQLRSLNLSSNRLTGIIPASLQQLSYLRVLMLHNNLLRGNIAELFSSSQRNLTTVQLSRNKLTGTLPDTVFVLPRLSSFAAVGNCFDGPLPEEAICGSTSLSVLVLDGLHSAPSCRRGASVTHEAFNLGPLPQCFLTMPTLATLHLSGSGLTGTLPAETNISAVLTDLSLSHNLLAGKIPRNILERAWNKLDLSYNRLTGTLHSSRAASYGNATKLFLQHNRLSGVIPGSMQRVGSLSLVENNMFSCRVDRSDVPQQDTDSDKYTCGSDAVNNSLYAWLCAAAAVVVVLGAMVYCGRINHAVSSMFAAVRDAKLSKLQDLNAAIDALRVLGIGGAGYCVAVLLPVYAAVNAFHPSFTYKYAWTVSAVFLTGTTAFVLEAVFLLLQLPVCAYAAERLLPREISPEQRVEGASSSSVGAQQTAAKVAVTLASLVVVTGINVAFVFATLNLNGRELTVIQILLAVFKLGFNNYAAPALRNRVRTLGVGNEITTSQVLLVLLNVVVIPCVVVMVISPACFYDALKGTDTVTSSYKYGGSCQGIAIANTASTGEVKITCADVQSELGTTAYTPAFAYSYQCSSSFVTYYAPTFVIMCIISSFVVPAYHLLLLWLRPNLSPTSRLYAIVTAATPRTLRELRSPQDFAQARNDPLYRPVFDANKLIMSLLTYLALLLTFGALFPPLAVCCAVAMASVALTARLEVGRYVNVAVAADRQDCLDEVESACAGVAGPQQLRMALYLILAVSCMFYTLFLFDALGYEVGFAGAFWALIVVPLLPVVAWVLHIISERVRSRVSVAASNADNSEHIPDPEVGVALAELQATKAVGTGAEAAAVATVGSQQGETRDTATSSANPMHAL
jgi:Leucine-rich repeat (LRR) protein